MRSLLIKRFPRTLKNIRHAVLLVQVFQKSRERKQASHPRAVGAFWAQRQPQRNGLIVERRDGLEASLGKRPICAATASQLLARFTLSRLSSCPSTW